MSEITIPVFADTDLDAETGELHSFRIDVPKDKVRLLEKFEEINMLQIDKTGEGKDYVTFSCEISEIHIKAFHDFLNQIGVKDVDCTPKSGQVVKKHS